MNAITDHSKVAVIGAGQAGLSVSYYLTQANISHVVLDRGGIAHAWKTQRWDSFTLDTPNWMVNLPGQPYGGGDPGAFMPRDAFVDYMTRWAEGFGVPIRAGVEVRRIARGPRGFCLETSKGNLTADAVVVATATYQHPQVPDIARGLAPHVRQLHVGRGQYQNPSDTLPGAVLVVGSGQTGSQIVEDLLRAGRQVYLCVGRSGRLPRRYRGRDCHEWYRDLGLLDTTPDQLGSSRERFAATPHLTGRDGGSTVSLHLFRERGVRLLGRLVRAEGTRLILGDNLGADLRHGDEFAGDLMRRIDRYIEENGLNAPPPSTEEMVGHAPAQDGAFDDPRSLDLEQAGINTVVWATGFGRDFSWIQFPVTDEDGYPVTDHGTTVVPGLYFCGLNWMVKRKSGILYGVAEDAERVAGDLAHYLLGHQDALHAPVAG